MGDRGATSYAYTGETTEWEVSWAGGLLASVMGSPLNECWNDCHQRPGHCTHAAPRKGYAELELEAYMCVLGGGRGAFRCVGC